MARNSDRAERNGLVIALRHKQMTCRLRQDRIDDEGYRGNEIQVGPWRGGCTHMRHGYKFPTKIQD